ncbi:MAG: hypothetical protein F4Y44_07775 [Chloroflexi bacterium]|nr:hypothetical protein [Chloroflexota bacterium]
MRLLASSVAISLVAAFALAVLAGNLPLGILSSENSDIVEASSREPRLFNRDGGASPQTKVDPLEATKSYVNDAIAAYRQDPEEALAYYRSEGSIVNDPPGLYLTLLDGGIIKANPVFRGAEGLSLSWREDPLGNRYGAKLAEADEDGAVVEYLLPISSQDYTFRKKTAWAIRAEVPDIDNPGETENLVFTAGWLDLEGDVESAFTEAQQAVAAVIEARARMQVEVSVPEVGTAVPTFNYYKSTDSIDGEIYVWLALPPNGSIAADATMPELVGRNIADVYPDVGEDMLAVQPQQARWLTHMWPNPQTNRVELKHSYVTNFVGIYIVSGYYGDTPPPTSADPCIVPIDGSGTFTGTWDNTCHSEDRPHDVDGGGEIGSDYYARFYTFTLNATASVTIILTSDDDPPMDTFLYLRVGEEKHGETVAENDDISSSNRNSRIVGHLLGPGTYTIEATTYNAGETGEFTLIVNVESTDETPEPPEPDVKYIAISSGANHVCAIAENGSIMCWGNEDGDNHGQVSDRPASGRFIQISSGDTHTCALRDDGAVRCWGSIDVP